MSRWTGRPYIDDVLSAADAWRERCFLTDGSLFSDENLWTLENIQELKNRCLISQFESKGQTFIAKLKEQLNGAPNSVIHLAAEFLWLLLLYPYFQYFRQETKRTQIQEVWECSGTNLPETDYLTDEALNGVGNPGAAYNILKFKQFEFVLEVMSEWKSLSDEQRTSLLTADTPWNFVAWIDNFENSDRPIRNAILYFVFPDHLERILNNQHRHQIVAALKHLLPAEHQPRGSNPSLEELDRAISQLRGVLEREYPDNKIDFYRPPVDAMWFSRVRDRIRSEIGAELKKVLSKYGLELYQCGSRQKTLDACKPVDESTGFWHEPADATSRPLRWFLHLELERDRVIARVPEAQGARRIAFANTARGTIGAITTRVVPVIKLAEKRFVFYEPWEWLLLHCFLPELPAGSSRELFENFDEASGKLTYMDKEQAYVSSGLIALQEDDSEFVASELPRSITYSEATQAISDLIHVVPFHTNPSNVDRE